MSYLEECPECKHDLGIALSRFFWNEIVGNCNTNEFEYLCPNCDTIMQVDVDMEPIFTVSKRKECQ
jgi:hypothetical protein